MANIPSLEMALKKKVKKTLRLPMHGKVSKKVSQMLEFLALLLKDTQLLQDGEMMLISLPQEFSASNHIASLENLIHQLTL